MIAWGVRSVICCSGFLPFLKVFGDDIDGGRALLGGQLFDRRGEFPIAHLRQRLRQRVEADDRDTLEVARLDRLDRAQRHVVVGGIDDLGRSAHAARGIR